MSRCAVLLSLLIPVLLSAAAAAEPDPWAAVRRGDYEAAEKVWRPRAERGEIAAEVFLGYLATVRDRPAEAAKWYRRAAAKGDAKAQTLLATQYLQGRGVAQDPVRAYAWYELAAAQGHVNAAKAREAAARQMSGEEIETAKRLAASWRAHGPPSDGE